jgi:phosphoglycerate dehydrogenase-like enzyme
MRVLLNGPIARRGRELLADHFGDRVELSEITGEEDAAGRAAMFADAEVLISMTFDGDHPPAPKLKLLQLPASGLDAVDIDAVPPGAAVCNVYEHETGIAEYVFAGMLQWVIGLPERDARFRRFDWADGPRMGAPTRDELAGQTVLLIGYGNIGRAIARRARAFDMGVLAATRNPRPLDPEPDVMAGYGDLPDLLPRADFVVVCCPLDDGTRGLIDAEGLAAMKPTGVILNVARGPVIDEDALYRALVDGTIAGAVLDTWYQYPDADRPDMPPSRHPFQELKNIVMTPHLSGWTTGQQVRRWAKTIENLEAVLEARPLINVVRPAA